MTAAAKQVAATIALAVGELVQALFEAVLPWAQALMFAAGATGGGYAGYKIGENLLLQPNWDVAPAV